MRQYNFLMNTRAESRVPPSSHDIAALDHAALAALLADVRAALHSAYGDGLVRLALFGSYARGDARAGSDVDVLAVLRGQVDPAREIGRNSEALAELSLRHDTVVSCVFVSEERFLREQSPFLMNVRRDAVAA